MFSFWQHILASQNMLSEWKLLTLVFVYPGYIQAHSCGQSECFAHAHNFRGAFEVEKYQMAFKVYSNCIMNMTAYVKY